LFVGEGGWGDLKTKEKTKKGKKDDSLSARKKKKGPSRIKGGGEDSIPAETKMPRELPDQWEEIGSDRKKVTS